MAVLSLRRAWTHACMIALAVGLAGKAESRPRTAPAKAAPAIAAGVQPQPLRFFTIASRLAALRSAGVLRPSQAPAIVGEPDAPADDEARVLDAAHAPAEIGVPPSSPVSRGVSPLDNAPALFGLAVFPVPGGELVAKWEQMRVRWERDQTLIARCEAGDCAHKGARKWLDLHARASALEGQERLAFVQSAINRAITYATDFQIHGVDDRWSSPLESIDRAGDCEDYAIAKYWLLRAAGIPADEMQLVALQERASGQYHAVLAVRAEEGWRFLDNKHAGLTREADYRDARPIAALNETGQSMLVQLAAHAMVRLAAAIGPAPLEAELPASSPAALP